MAEDGSLESIERHGLLSTTALLDLYGVRGEERYAVESCRRPGMVRLVHPEHGVAWVRDNKPMQEKTLSKCLVGITPRQWYETLNHRVFFWVDEQRLMKLLNAKAYRGRSHLVLELDTAKLIKRHAQHVTLSGINSGATFPLGPVERGSHTFECIADFPEDKKVVEFTVDHAVPDVVDFVLSVTRWQGGEKVGVVREKRP